MKSKKNTQVFNNTLTEDAVEYLSAIEKTLVKGTRKRHQFTLIRLYQWLSVNCLSIEELTPEKVTAYHRGCLSRGLQPSTADTEYYTVRSYVIWLIRNGRLKGSATAYFPYSIKNVELPECAVLFLKHRAVHTKYAHVRFRQLLNLFHNWLLDQKLELAGLDRNHILSFLHFLGARGYTKRQLHIRHLYVRIYLDWLRDRDITTVDCRDVFATVEQFRNFELPKCAEQYLNEIALTLRADTVKNYKTNFMGLHRFLHREGVEIKDIKREDCVGWMRFMFENKKYSASTRLQRLVNTRGYLYWLAEHEYLKTDVDKLIKCTDFPKLDLVLPKPLAPNIDTEIQKRLAASENIYHKGALLLRMTGMRLGELANLAYDPIWRDNFGKTYIKIPIGKLHNERLVPIDDKGIKLIENIQRGSLPHLRQFSKEPEKGKLLLGPKGGSALHNVYRLFKIISKDLAGQGSIHPHRLRHTFATTLMNAGLNPLIVMALLGHKDLRMTYRYSLITSETIYRDFFKAVDQSTFKIEFKMPDIPPLSGEFSPEAAIENVEKWLQRDLAPEGRQTVLLIKRLNRLRSEIAKIKK